jgi:hypothetical protein
MQEGKRVFREQEEVMTTDWDKIRELLGEAIHTGFRKGCDTLEADTISKLITKMPSEDWSRYVDWVFSAIRDSVEDA